MKGRWLQILFLMLWTGLGLCLRFANLTLKPLWTDEFSTIAFSLGNGFLGVPLDEVITTDQLLQPLQTHTDTGWGLGLGDVIDRLFSESNHPPLYFWLCHLWLHLFPTADPQVNPQVLVWAVRALSALLGAAAIPATYLLSWLAFRSPLTAQIAAALMAVSPFGVYLSQEARHYTLPILFVIASLGCLIMAVRRIRHRISLPLWVCLVWIGANGLGIATHYLFAITLAAEAIVILTLGLVQSWRERGIWYPSHHWQRIWLVALGTLATSLVWLPVLSDVQDSSLTQWIIQNDRSGLEWLDPIGQTVASWITMFYLLPIQSESPLIVAISGAVLILLTLWTIPKVYWGIKFRLTIGETHLPTWALLGFTGISIAIFLGISYGLERDLTSAFRYHFVYFPAVIVLVSGAIATGWQAAQQIAHWPADRLPSTLLRVLRTNGRRATVLILVAGLMGSSTVVMNLGYQKTHRPDLVARSIGEQSDHATLIAIVHQTHGQTGRLMGIAWQLKYSGLPQLRETSDRARFLLAHQGQTTRSLVNALRQAIIRQPYPLDLWLINFQSVPDAPVENVLRQQNCRALDSRVEAVDGYRYRHYRCGTEFGT